MNRMLSLAGLAFGLLLLFLAGVFFTHTFLQQQTYLVRLEAFRARKVQLQRTLEIAGLEKTLWSEPFVHQLGAALDAEAQLLPAVAPQPDKLSGPRWQFDRVVQNPDGSAAGVLRVQFVAPPISRLAAAEERAGMVIITTALLLVAFGLILVFSRRPGEAATASPSDTARSSGDMQILGHLAARSTRQGAELEQERLERLRAENDADQHQALLHRALEDKVAIGRDLHDGLIQSLYAIGLTLEAARRNFETNPAEARSQIESSLASLKESVREVRGFITGMTPEQVRQQTFAQAVQGVTRTFGTGRKAQFDVRIDDGVAARLNDVQFTDLLQIVREAVSNAVRHGEARQITVRLHESAGEMCLLVQDNGKGFAPDRVTGGNGLANMRARAARLGANLRCTSEPGQGTRVVLTLSLQAAVPS